MIWPPQDTGLFELKKPCCACPSSCPGALLLPLAEGEGVETYASEAAALAAMADYVGDCLVYSLAFQPVLPALTAVFAADELTITATAAASPGGIWLVCSINAAAGSSISIERDCVNLQPTGHLYSIFHCLDYNPGLSTPIDIEELVSAAGTGTVTLGPLPAAGEYLLRIAVTANSAEFIVSADDASLTVNPVVAVYDAGGGPVEVPCV